VVLEFRWDAGKGAVCTADGRATRRGGYIHCPHCAYPALYYERKIDGQVCVNCGREYENRAILKPVVIVRR